MIHIIWSVLLWLLVALLALLILCLVLPVFVLVEYKNKQFSAKLRVLFLTFQLYPSKKQPEEKPVAEKSEENPSEKPKQQSQKKKITLDKIMQIFSVAGSGVKMLLRGIFITGIRINYPVYREDAAETAIAYGQTQASLGTAVGLLRNFVRLRFKKVNIFADFDNTHNEEEYFYCKIGATPFIMVSVAIYVFTRLKSEKLL